MLSFQTYCSLPISLSESAAICATADSERCLSSDSAPPTNANTRSYLDNKGSVPPIQDVIDKNANSIGDAATDATSRTVANIPPVVPPRRRKKAAAKTVSEPLLDEIDGANVSRCEGGKVARFDLRKTSSNKEDTLNGGEEQKMNLVKQFKRSVSMKDRTKNKECRRTKFGVTNKDVLVDMRGNKDVIVDSFRKLKSRMSKPGMLLRTKLPFSTNTYSQHFRRVRMKRALIVVHGPAPNPPLIIHCFRRCVCCWSLFVCSDDCFLLTCVFPIAAARYQRG